MAEKEWPDVDNVLSLLNIETLYDRVVDQFIDRLIDWLIYVRVSTITAL